MLTDEAIQTAKPGAKPYKLYDGLGLCLLVATNGGKWWRFKYRFRGRENLLSLGTYPDTSLAEARRQRDGARKLKAAGIDPSVARKLARAGQRLERFEKAPRDEETVIDELARKIALRVADMVAGRR